MPFFTNFTPTEVQFDDGLGLVALKWLPSGNWKLLQPIQYKTLAGVNIIIPAGFTSDGASSPLHVLITEWGGHYGTAALFHDYLYSRLNAGNPHPAAKTRAAADGILMEIMTRTGVNYLTKLGIYLAVRAFGGPFFKKLGVRP